MELRLLITNIIAIANSSRPGSKKLGQEKKLHQNLNEAMALSFY
jgi:hypothetical protein